MQTDSGRPPPPPARLRGVSSRPSGKRRSLRAPSRRESCWTCPRAAPSQGCRRGRVPRSSAAGSSSSRSPGAPGADPALSLRREERDETALPTGRPGATSACAPTGPPAPTQLEGLQGQVQAAVVRLGGGVEDHGARLRALHGLRGALANGAQRHTAGVIVVDQVAQHAAVGEGHREVLHLVGASGEGREAERLSAVLPRLTLFVTLPETRLKTRGDTQRREGATLAP